MAKLHCGVKGWKLSENYKDADYVQVGVIAVNTGKLISRWHVWQKQDESDKEVWVEDRDVILD